jgi:nitronate monooxygenase
VENIMWSKTLLTEKLGIRYPIIQAPLAGGVDTPRLVAAVSTAGGLGSIGAAYLSPDQIRASIREVRRLCDRPFAVNLFAPGQGVKPTATADELDRVNAVLSSYRAELGLPAASAPAAAPVTFDAQLAIVVEERVPIFSFTSGALPAERVRELKALGIATLGTATTVREGVILAESGVDGIVAQGSEAGGHRASFASPPERALIGTMGLVPRLVDRTGVPIIAAGGIMDGRGVVAALSLGAAAVQMGSAFVTCTESGANEGYKRALLNAGDEDDTTLTRAFSGRTARGRRNRFVNEMDGRPDAILAYPLQSGLTKDIRQTAAARDVPDLMPLWCGQGPARRATQSAGELIAELVSEAEQILARLHHAP